jgi:ribosomal protein S18 acetylase RimI-like enzyme
MRSALWVQEMMFTVRRARVEDANAIAFVQVESWKTTYAGIVPDAYLASLSVESRTEKWKEQFDAGTTLIFVAEDAAGVFGFVSGGILRDTIDDYDGELYAIYLLQERQKQGVGKVLLQKLAEAMRADGFQRVIAWVLAQNPSIGFYVRLGGSPVAEKQIEIGGVQLTEIAFGWTNLDDLL